MAHTQTKTAGNEPIASGKKGKHRLDRLDPSRVAKNLVLFHPDETNIAAIMAEARKSIPGLAEDSAVLNAVRHNPDCFFAVARKSQFNPAVPVAEGFIAMLPLNRIGMDLLAMDALEGSRPNVKFLAAHGEQPEAIYWWAIYAPGPLAAGMALFLERITAKQYAGLDIYAKPVTAEGTQFLDALGFTYGARVGNQDAPHLWVFPRKPLPPLYDSYMPGAAPGEIGVTIARTFEDMNRVFTIRSAVYIGEQECPYDEEYDGNDLAATHLLAYIGDEPVGCLRVRYFAGFAKIERLAIRKEFRKTRAAFQLVRAGFKLCQAKGYAKVYGHSQVRLVNFWSRFGFRVPENARRFVFSDFDYVEIVADIEPDPQAITLEADPYVIIRPEGRWHKPGILEKSANRTATNPSVITKR